MKEKVILAYSGGLDTTAVIPWLKEKRLYNIVKSFVQAVEKLSETGVIEKADKKAKDLLGWSAKLNLEDMCKDAFYASQKARE